MHSDAIKFRIVYKLVLQQQYSQYTCSRDIEAKAHYQPFQLKQCTQSDCKQIGNCSCWGAYNKKKVCCSSKVMIIIGRLIHMWNHVRSGTRGIGAKRNSQPKQHAQPHYKQIGKFRGTIQYTQAYSNTDTIFQYRIVF